MDDELFDEIFSRIDSLCAKIGLGLELSVPMDNTGCSLKLIPADVEYDPVVLFVIAPTNMPENQQLMFLERVATAYLANSSTTILKTE